MKTFCVGIDAVTARFFHVRAENEKDAREKLAIVLFRDEASPAQISDVEYHAENDEEYVLESIRSIEDCASLEEPEEKP